MHKFVQNLAQLWELGEISNLLGTHVIERLPRKLLLLLQFAEYVFWDVLELPQRIKAAPHRLVNHLSHIEGPKSCLCPPLLEGNFVETSHDPGGRLGDIDLVGVKGETL